MNKHLEIDITNLLAQVKRNDWSGNDTTELLKELTEYGVPVIHDQHFVEGWPQIYNEWLTIQRNKRIENLE